MALWHHVKQSDLAMLVLTGRQMLHEITKNSHQNKRRQGVSRHACKGTHLGRNLDGGYDLCGSKSDSR